MPQSNTVTEDKLCDRFGDLSLTLPKMQGMYAKSAKSALFFDCYMAILDVVVSLSNPSQSCLSPLRFTIFTLLAS